MGYENSKIYKLQCDDGYYYIGSTTTELRCRLYKHKNKSKTYLDRTSYQHINEIGWDRVRIVLMEAFCCNNRDELRMKEDEHICKHRDDPFCLNTYRAFLTEEEKKQYYEVNKDEIREKQKIYNEVNKERIREQRRAYREANKERKREYDRLYRQKKKSNISSEVGEMVVAYD